MLQVVHLTSPRRSTNSSDWLQAVGLAWSVRLPITPTLLMIRLEIDTPEELALALPKHGTKRRVERLQLAHRVFHFTAASDTRNGIDRSKIWVNCIFALVIVKIYIWVFLSWEAFTRMSFAICVLTCDVAYTSKVKDKTAIVCLSETLCFIQPQPCAEVPSDPLYDAFSNSAIA